MADQNTTDVNFEADPKLEKQAGAADVNFEPEADMGGEEGPKRSASETIREAASKFSSQAADRAKDFAGEGKERATGALDEVAKLFEGAALDVDARLGEQYGQYARTAANGISSFADGLRNKEVDDLISDATELVRKSPVIAVGAAAAVGFVIARLLKSGLDAAGDAADAADPAPKS